MIKFKYSKWDGTQEPFSLDAEEIIGRLSDLFLDTSDFSWALSMMMRKGITDEQGQRVVLGIDDLLRKIKGLRQQYLSRYSSAKVFEEMRQKLNQLLAAEQAHLEELMRSWNPGKARSERQGGLSPEQLQELWKRLMGKPGDPEPEMIDPEDLHRKLKERIKKLRFQRETLPMRLSEALKLLRRSSFTQSELEAELAQLLGELKRVKALEEFFEQYHFKGKEPLSFEEAWKLLEIFQLLSQLEQNFENTRWGGDVEEIDSSLVKKLLGEEAYQAIEQWKQINKLLTEAGYMVKSGNKSQLTPKGIRKIGQKALKDIFAALKRDALGQHPLNLKGLGGTETQDTKRYQYGDPFYLDLGRTLMNSLGRQGGRSAPLSPGLDSGSSPKSPGTPLLPEKRREAGLPDRSVDPIRNPPPRPSLTEKTKEKGELPNRPLKARIELSPEDFEVYRMQHLTESSTVLMLDMSWSMAWFNRFFAAKKVALALYHLIKGQFPKDNLSVVGFYSTARELSFQELPFAQLCAGTYGTNMQAGLRVSSRLLARERALNKQIIMVTDGEPTAHYEDGQLFFQYPPGEKTLIETLREVERCTREGITINVFMLSSDYYLAEFVNKITQINKGRAFYTTPENLGKYLLIDYISGKRKRIL